MVAQFDPSNIDFQNLSDRERQTLDYLRGLANRGPSAIGTSGLTGEDISTASEIVGEAPTMMETGYGPKEFNPQQRYEQRYQMRSGVGDESSPFEDLQQNIAMGNLQQDLPYTPDTSPSFMGDGNGGEGGGYSPDMGTLGHFGMEAFTGSLEDMGIKAGTNFGLASFLGLAPEVAAKFGLTSIFNPMTMAALMGKTAYGSVLDMATGQMANDSMVGDVNADLAGPGPEMGPTTEAAAQMSASPQARAAGMLGVDVGGKYGLGQYGAYDTGPTAEQQAIKDIEAMSPFEQLSAAVEAAIRGPQGGWMSSTDIDPVTGLHRGQLDNDPMGVSRAMGLQSSFGDPFGSGLGRRGGSGDGGGRSGGRSGGGMSDAGGFGTGDRGDREGGGWV